jgi:hypothetical protein
MSACTVCATLNTELATADFMHQSDGSKRAAVDRQPSMLAGMDDLYLHEYYVCNSAAGQSSLAPFR